MHVEIKSTFTAKLSSLYIPDGLSFLTKNLEKHEFLSTSEPSLKELLATEIPSFSGTAAKIQWSCCFCYRRLCTAQGVRASGPSIAHGSAGSNSSCFSISRTSYTQVSALPNYSPVPPYAGSPVLHLGHLFHTILSPV